uniref:Ras-GAP domain-containing protein n=2 Tax=Mesocestoides corti TaxID=53468 RepID=A0A5K3EM34_MESCO
RYYCDVCLDRTLYARTTSKPSTGNSIFWAEEFDLNNLPDVSILTISLYREADGGGRDIRRGLLTRSNSKKLLKKSQNRLVGFVTLPVVNICSRNPAQTWLTLQPPSNADLINPALINPIEFGTSNSVTCTNGISSPLGKPHGSSNTVGGTGVRLRVSVRYKSIDILPIRAYAALHSLVRENAIEFTEWLEHLIPLKLKEEVASCLVNLHEQAGTAAAFLTDLVVREVSELENESMTFRSNTMATKAVESYIKLVGKEYLHKLLHRYIQRVLICPDTWEVDPDKLSPHSLSAGSLLSPDGQGTSTSATIIIQDYCARKLLSTDYEQQVTPNSLSRLAVLTNGRVAQPGSLIFSQTQLLQHLDFVWDAVCASIPDFPRPLLEVFSAFRSVLQPSKGAEFCDKLISACIFLRFVCPAILTPSLFGLASTFPGESSCQRNLTLIAKSLQSLANLSTFGDKESFMRFMNAYVEIQIPVMRTFLRDISSLPDPFGHCSQSVSPVANSIDCGYELACLQTICFELFNASSASSSQQNTSTSLLTTSPGKSPLTSLPPSLIRLPEIITHLENIKNGIAIESDFTETQSIFDPSYASGDSRRRLLATADGKCQPHRPLLPRFTVSMEDSMGPFEAESLGGFRSLVDNTPMNSSIQKPTAVRPKTMRMTSASPGDQQSSIINASKASMTKSTSMGNNRIDKVTLREIRKASAFPRGIEGSRSGVGSNTSAPGNDLDYDDPYNDDVYDSTLASRRRTIYDAPYEEPERTGGQVSANDESPAHTLHFPSPPSAFSLYRRPAPTAVSGTKSITEVPVMECAASPVTIQSTTANSRTSSGVSSGCTLHTSPRKAHQVANLGKGQMNSTFATGENLVLEPRPNPVITHIKHLSRSSTNSSSSGRSSLTNKQDLVAHQHHYPFRQAVNANLAKCASDVANGTSSKRKSQMSSSMENTSYQVDCSFANDSTTATTIGSTVTKAGGGVLPNSALPRVKSSGFTGAHGHQPHAQLILKDNEQLLSSTLEELGDAVAWLERERSDLLSMQERRLLSNHPPSRTVYNSCSNVFAVNSTCGVAPLTNSRKGALSTPQTSAASGMNTATSTVSSSPLQQHLNPHTSSPTLHLLNCTHPTADEIVSLTRSANSLTEQNFPHHQHRRSAVSKTFTLTRSGSASVSPSRRSREGSDSSDNACGYQVRRKRTTTLIPASKVLSSITSNSVNHRSGPQTPVERRRIPGTVNDSDEVTEHPMQQPQKQQSSFVSTWNCNLYIPNNPPNIADAGRSQRRSAGAGFILSGSPLLS